MADELEGRLDDDVFAVSIDVQDSTSTELGKKYGCRGLVFATESVDTVEETEPRFRQLLG